MPISRYGNSRNHFLIAAIAILGESPMGQPPLVCHYDAHKSLLYAEAFQRAAERSLPRISEDEDLREGILSPSRSLGDLVVAATNLSFALELYIKTISVGAQMAVPRTHDLGKLYAALPNCFRVVTEDSYETRKENWYGKRASISIAVGRPHQKPPEWDDNRREPQDLGAVLNRSGDLFSSWRYIWEFTEAGQGKYQYHRFEYGLLLCACQAIRAAIQMSMPNSTGKK
jgi:hypothetical protein